jgi:hypothetical protein
MEAEEKSEVLPGLGIEQRRRPRFPVEEQATLLLVDHGSTLPCNVQDLSLEGCRVRTKDRFPAGSKVRIEVGFKVNGIAFRFSGTVQWTDGRNTVGIRFAEMSSRRRDELAEVLSEVKEDLAAKAAREAAERLAVEQQAAAQEAEGEQEEEDEAEEPAVEHVGLAAVKQVARPAGQHSGRQATSAQVPVVRNTQERPQPGLVPKPRPVQPEIVPQAASVPVVLSPTDRGILEAVAAEANSELQVERLVESEAEPMPQPEEATEPEIVTEAAPATLIAARLRRRERRTHSRHEVDTSAVIFLINVASKLKGRILDLSMNGCRIRTDDRFPVGIYTRVEVEFRLEGLPFRLGGVIQAIHDFRLVGIRFLDMSERKRRQVEELIDEIQEMKELRAAGKIANPDGSAA